MRDLFNDIKVTPLFITAVATQAANPAAIVIDRAGFESVVLELLTGVGGITFTGTNRIDWTVTECDTSGGSYTAVAEDDLQLEAGETWASGGIVRSIIAAHTSQTLKKVGYIGNKRFLKCVPVFGGTHSTGTSVAGSAILSDASYKPVV